MAGRLEGKVAAITGAASGFGAAAARRFVLEGAKVVMGDIQDAPGQALADELGDAARYVHCDVTIEEQVANMVDTAVSEFGQLDIMYNNAGIVGSVGPIATTPADEWKRTFDIHVHGTFYGCKHAARVMIPRKAGSIVSMTSTAGIMGGLGPHAYAAAKHAIVGITKNVAAELAQHGIRVNCIAPAGMATAMVAALSGDHTAIEETEKALALASPLKGRGGRADDVVNAALWLASDEAGYTSGHTLTTDAGYTTGAAFPTPFAEREDFVAEAGKRGMDS
ncbi:SDR family oxidoreductase [Halieaceae bacterium IMCC14734]|uniref:SDR family oxidoreductase n=1 Tax=Candidatus Litorirhabdus singularis TaxID=2518993 RepID=A0ABT3TEA4_9GAMM|nr:glucose 1-dehydrogenase [Candidatus Litorirhabdus singularis]MCX2980616.1 SDR family oxidoreductase [Candidatus Litorirhabdus singularis]